MPRNDFDTDKIRFTKGAAGGVIAFRPNEILVATPPGVSKLEDIVNLALTPVVGTERQSGLGQVGELFNGLVEWLRGIANEGDKQEDPEQRQRRLEEIERAAADLRDNRDATVSSRPSLRRSRSINEKWSVLVPATKTDDIDPVEFSRVLRAAGLVAQPNYVRFINTLGSAPNYIAPNYIAPNYIAPNYIAPNYIAPNYIAPNYIAPNYIAPSSGHAGACNCEACPDAPHVERSVPMISARGAYGPLPGPDPFRLPVEVDAEIHVLDVRFQADKPTLDFRADITAARAGVNAEAKIDGEVRDRFAEAIFVETDASGKPSPTGPSRALLPLFLRLFKTAKGTSDEDFEAALAAFLDEPTSDGLGANVNDDNFLDPTTNHAEFIQGIIDRVIRATDGSSLVRHHAIAGTLGDVSDEDLARSLDWVVEQHSDVDKLQILNLSLSGYTDDDLPAPILADAISAAQAEDWLIVASAGNNGSCRLAWPGALEGVVSVAAYGPTGPASFSNHGPWVDACGPGVGVVSTFTTPANTALQVVEAPETVLVAAEFDKGDPEDRYASWSGTSFSAPYVAAMIAARVAKKLVKPGVRTLADLVREGLDEMISGPDLIRFPDYGTIVSSEAVTITQQITRDPNN